MATQCTSPSTPGTLFQTPKLQQKSFIISDQPPWRNLSQSNAGWDLPLHQPQRWQDILRKCYEMEQEEYDKLCNGAHTLARTYIEKSNFKEQYQELFSTQ